MKVKGTIENILFDSKGHLTAIFACREPIALKWGKYLEELQKTQEGSLQTVKIDVSKWREGRSLNANAYFHVLVDKIAEAVGIGAEECKVKMVLEYGTVAIDQNGDAFKVVIPTSADIGFFYPYAKLIAEYDDMSEYFLYKHTHTLDSKEMARLIDGVIYEAEQLGIETATPEEKAKMLARWQGEKQKK
jgi:hypothetical protein